MDPKGLISIDSWDEFFDLSKSTSIARAYGNWQARLAIATAVYKEESALLFCREAPVFDVSEVVAPSPKFDVIVA